MFNIIDALLASRINNSEIIAAFFAAYAFGILFNIKGKYLVIAGIGGGFAGGVTEPFVYYNGMIVIYGGVVYATAVFDAAGIGNSRTDISGKFLDSRHIVRQQHGASVRRPYQHEISDDIRMCYCDRTTFCNLFFK